MSENQNKNLEITMQPKYSSKKDKDGNYVVSYSIGIDGQQFSKESKAKTREQALNQSRERVTRSLMKEPEYESKLKHIKNNNIEGLLDVEPPTQETPEQYSARKNQGPSLETPQSDLGFNPSALNNVDELEKLTEEQSKVIQNQNNTPKKPKEKVFKKSEKYRNHVAWVKENGDGQILDGTGRRHLIEPVPNYFKRTGDAILTAQSFGGTDNNATIAFTRDMSPLKDQLIFSRDISKTNYVSGYSNHMGAGAIDIVVGRMAPYPLATSNKTNSNQGADSGKGRPKWTVAPCFNTIEGQSILSTEKLITEKGTFSHPGMMMDAARVYISQLTDVDENFKLFPLPNAANPTASGKRSLVPTSAIMLKADKLRMHARQDIKIVTGGPFEKINSLGNRITVNNGIHLIAQNGVNRDGKQIPQHPMVLGDNLIKALEEILKLQEDTAQALDHMVSVQMIFNNIIAKNFDLLPLPAGTTIPNPFKTIADYFATLELTFKTRFGTFFQMVNNFRANTTYLKDSGKDENFILSRYNTVN